MADATQLPDDAYLRTYYHDVRQRVTHIYVYYEDGRVEYSDGKTSSDHCHFTDAEVAQAKKLLTDCGIWQATDVALDGAHDVALERWAWRLEGQAGSFANHAYPALEHPVILCAREQLYEMEQAARAREG